MLTKALHYLEVKETLPNAINMSTISGKLLVHLCSSKIYIQTFSDKFKNTIEFAFTHRNRINKIDN